MPTVSLGTKIEKGFHSKAFLLPQKTTPPPLAAAEVCNSLPLLFFSPFMLSRPFDIGAFVLRERSLHDTLLVAAAYSAAGLGNPR
jgi:hypothetical protein